jgi:hypothetical protein
VPTTIEVNPFLADLIEAKLARYDFDVLVSAYGSVRREARSRFADIAPYASTTPSTFIEPGVGGRYLFSHAVASRFFAYREAIETIQNDAARRLFGVLLASLAVAVSNAVVSGKGRRYRTKWKERPTHPDRVDELFEHLALEAIGDIRRFDARRCRQYSLLRGDARILISDVGQRLRKRI